MLSRPVALTLTVAVTATMFSGCGGSDNPPQIPVILNTKRVEKAIEDSIRAKRDVEADVDCPSGVHQREGLTFECVATTSAGSTVFVVEQKDSNGNVTYAAR